MGIFDLEELTANQKRVNAIKAYAANNLIEEKARCLNAFNMLWEGLNTKEDAQAIFDLFGNDAIQLFLLHRAWQTFISSIDASYEWLVPPFEITYNQDGTVTVGEKIEITEGE